MKDATVIPGRNNLDSNALISKSLWVRRETLKIHQCAPEVRIASSLSAVELLAVLYYGGFMKFDPVNPGWHSRDRLIASKGHGSIALFPILADNGYFSMDELTRVGKEGSFLGGIPDTIIPGYETINGSLGHGLGVACGMGYALKIDGNDPDIYVLVGDGELYEGALWEAAMFAAHHALDNITLIIDNNKISMLGYCKDIVRIESFEKKFDAFGWECRTVDGHDTKALHATFGELKALRRGKPKVLVANTVKGKGVPRLEQDPMSHVQSLKREEVDAILEKMI